MNNLKQFEFARGWLLTALLFALVASGCTIEKRTLMSGFHVEHRSKAAQGTPAERLPEQAPSVAKTTSDAYASSEVSDLDFFEPETDELTPTRVRTVAPVSIGSTHAFVLNQEGAMVALADTTAGPANAMSESPEFTKRELNKWRARSILRALMSLSAAAIAFISAAVDGFALSYFLGVIFVLAAVKWMVLATSPKRLRKWRDERARARQDRTLKSILIRVLKWLIAVPLSIALLLGLLFSMSGGL